MKLVQFDHCKHDKYVDSIRSNPLLDWRSIGEPLSEKNAENTYVLEGEGACAHIFDLQWRERNCELILTLADKNVVIAQMLLESVFEICFAQLDLHAVYLYALEEDEAIICAAISLGLKPSGILRSRVYHECRRHDVVVYSIVAPYFK